MPRFLKMDHFSLCNRTNCHRRKARKADNMSVWSRKPNLILLDWGDRFLEEFGLHFAKKPFDNRIIIFLIKIKFFSY